MIKKILSVLTIVVVTATVFTNTVFADYYSSNTTLYKSMSGTEVTNLQNDLKRLGYYDFTSTGYFGDVTRNAVIKYQMDNYLYGDGIVGHATAREIKVDKVIQQGKQYMGVPYVWGGTSPSGFDCSGFVHYTLLKNGITIPRTTELQYNAGSWVSKDKIRPGDLVFFTTYRPGPSHVGIYIGNGQFIHASSGAEKVTISDFNKSYYAERFIGAKRVIQ
ncbi:MAG: NlpC/P60 family protein [Clostridia bacterium]|nr:NlpC/P60 family protein [Clostridia bacterium]